MNVLFPFGERWDVDLSSLFYHSTTISQHLHTETVAESQTHLKS